MRRLGAGLNKVKAETALSVLAYNILRAINLVGASGLRAAAAKAQSDQLQVDIQVAYFATCSRSSAGTRKLGKKITRGENKTCGRTVAAGNVSVNNYSLGNFPNIRLHGYGRVNDIFPNDLPSIRVGPGRPDWFEPAVRDQDFG